MTRIKKTKSSEYIKETEVLYLRTSLLKQYLRCPAQCLFRYFKGLVIPPRSYATMGSCFHKSAEHHYKYKLKKGKNEKLTVLQDVFHEEFQKRKRETKWLRSEDPNELEVEGVKSMLPTYYNQRAVRLDPKYVEESFQVYIPEANVYITGTMDLILSDDEIRDHKTRSRMPNWIEPLKSTQGYSYTLGFIDKFKKKPKCFRLDYVLRKKGYTEVESSKEVKHNKDELEDFKGTVVQVVNSIRQGIFYPRCESNYMCSPNTCGFWGICHKGQWKNIGVFSKVYGSNEGNTEEDGE